MARMNIFMMNPWADGPVYSQGSGFTQEIEIEDGELVETRVYVDGERVEQVRNISLALIASDIVIMKEQ